MDYVIVLLIIIIAYIAMRLVPYGVRLAYHALEQLLDSLFIHSEFDESSFRRLVVPLQTALAVIATLIIVLWVEMPSTTRTRLIDAVVPALILVGAWLGTQVIGLVMTAGERYDMAQAGHWRPHIKFLDRFAKFALWLGAVSLIAAFWGYAFVQPILIVLLVFGLRWFTPTLLHILFRMIDQAAQNVSLDTMIDEAHLMRFARPLRFLITAVGVGVALDLMPLSDEAARWAARLAITGVIIGVFWVIYTLAALTFFFLKHRAKDDSTPETAIFNETIIDFANRLAKLAVVVVAISVIVQSWGYDFPALLAGLGLGGLAIALAAQESIANFIGYLTIISDRPFSVGDYVVTADVEGVVELIAFRTTHIRQPDGALVLVPNNKMASATITNWTLAGRNAGPRRGRARLNMTLGVTYKTTADQIGAVVEQIETLLCEDDKILKDSVIVKFVNFGDSSLDILIVCVVRRTSWADFQDSKQRINLGIMRILEGNGVEVAFPTRTLYVEQDAEADPALLGD